MKSNREIGTEYEAVAAAYLQKTGYDILIHNYKNKMGEIDLIAKEGSQLVFIEVKYRKNLSRVIRRKRLMEESSCESETLPEATCILTATERTHPADLMW